MPTYFILLKIRFFARAYDILNEPCHIHATKGFQLCKYWIFKDETIELADNVGFSKKELSEIEKLIKSRINFVQQEYENYCLSNGIIANYKTKKS